MELSGIQVSPNKDGTISIIEGNIHLTAEEVIAAARKVGNSVSDGLAGQVKALVRDWMQSANQYMPRSHDVIACATTLTPETSLQQWKFSLVTVSRFEQ